MIYTEGTKKAMRLMFQAQRAQTDKGGLPYVFHPFYLAAQMQDEATTIVALLHDVLEDTDTTPAQLREQGFSQELVDALLLLTHDKNTDYMTYIRRIKANPIAAAVKRADLMHNSDLTRLDTVDERALARVEKYQAALRLLTEEPI